MLTMEEAMQQSPVNFAAGDIVKGTIIEVRSKEVLVDIGYKSEGSIPGNEFDDIKTVNAGDVIDVLIERCPVAIEQGMRFAIREGGRTIGAGVVSKIIA
jgi:ribosomal protein S1